MKMEMENDGKNKGLSLNYFKRRKAKITYSKEDHLILFLFIKREKQVKFICLKKFDKYLKLSYRKYSSFTTK